MITPYVVQVGDIPARYAKLLLDAHRLFDEMPKHSTCHEVCAEWLKQYDAARRNVRREARVVTGHYMGCYAHSWIELRPKFSAVVILDLYPVGGMRPLMFTKYVFTSGLAGQCPAYRDLYLERTDIVSSKKA